MYYLLGQNIMQIKIEHFFNMNKIISTIDIDKHV